MKKMILIFSHVLTEKQIEDAKKNLNITEFIYLPKNLQQKWSLIPPDLKDISTITDEIKEWVINLADDQDYILVQGDYGATFDLVQYLKVNGCKVVHSTTLRRAKEMVKEDGKIEITHVFEHIMFREY